MSAALRLGDDWGIAAAADRRFRRLGAACVGLVLALQLWLQLWPIAEAPRAPPAAPLRVQLLRPPPPPAPPPPRPPSATAVPRPPPATKAPPQHSVSGPAPSARAIAERSGVMALREQLSTLRDHSLGAALSQQPLLHETALVTGNSARASAALSASAAAGSGGIGGGSRSVSAVQGTGTLGARRAGEVHSTLGAGAAAPGGDGERPGGSRSLQELQLAFDRSKSSFFAIFNRAARERADMAAGRIVVSLTIAPDGSVARCELVSSSFDDAALEQKILQRVKLLNFGAKNVPPYTYPNYPISFLPS